MTDEEKQICRREGIANLIALAFIYGVGLAAFVLAAWND